MLFRSVDDRLAPRLDELRDLKASWNELARIWSAINELKLLPWPAVTPRAIKAKMDDLLLQLINLPARVRACASFDFTVSTVNAFIKATGFLNSLKSNAVKERHWKDIMKVLTVSWNLSTLTLGQLWDVDLAKYGAKVQEITNQAQVCLTVHRYSKVILCSGVCCAKQFPVFPLPNPTQELTTITTTSQNRPRSKCHAMTYA